MAYWSPTGTATSLERSILGFLHAFADRVAIRFFLILSVLLAARLLMWRTGFYKAQVAYLDLLPTMSLSTAWLRWFTTYHEGLLRGVMADIMLAGMLTILLAWLSGWPWRIALLGIVVFCAANVEHIKYNHAHIDISALKDGFNPTFIRGSLTLDAAKYALAISAALGFVVAIRNFPYLRHKASHAMIGLVMIAALAMPRPGFDAPGWMQSSPLFSFGSDGRLPFDSASPPPYSLAEAGISTSQPSNYNLLIVYLEGLSLSSLERGDMQTLKDLSRTGITFDNFVSRQIITANGLYATLTGDAPSFLRRYPRWDALENGSEVARAALPNRLAQSGYHTVYLQAADLGFMNKDSRMASLGFEVIKGEESWNSARARNGWGIDDLTLMDEALAYLDNDRPPGPWFMGVLTSGTHSPYNVPGIDTPTRREALQQSDRAVAALIAGLRDRGLLDTTTIIVTSDEGREITTGAGFLNDLPLNRLPLIVLHPDLGEIHVPDYLMNTDLADLAITLTRPLDEDALMASLPRHEDLVFGNVITGKVFWYDVDDARLTGCRLPQFDCVIWANRPTLFDSDSDALDPVRLPLFAEMLDAHDRNVAGVERADLVTRSP